MSEKSCPNCGIALGVDTLSCACGYDFTDDEFSVPAPGIVRSGGTEQDPTVSAGRAAMVMKAAPAPAPKPRPAPRPAPAPAPSAVRANEMLMMGCPACKARISRRAQKCPKCGVSPYDHCLVCAERILAGSAPCPECGDPSPFEAARAG